MRCSLRTIALFAGVGLSLLMLLWFALYFVWIAAPTPFMRRLADYGIMPGIFLTLALIVLSCRHRRGEMAHKRVAGLTLPAALWLFETLALSIWLSVIIGLAGWIFIWGDNGPRVSSFTLHLCAILGAVLVSSLTTINISIGAATANYVRVVAAITLILLILIAPYFLWHLAYHGSLRAVSFFS